MVDVAAFGPAALGLPLSDLALEPWFPSISRFSVAVLLLLLLLLPLAPLGVLLAGAGLSLARVLDATGCCAELGPVKRPLGDLERPLEVEDAAASTKDDVADGENASLGSSTFPWVPSASIVCAGAPGVCDVGLREADRVRGIVIRV